MDINEQRDYLEKRYNSTIMKEESDVSDMSLFSIGVAVLGETDNLGQTYWTHPWWSIVYEVNGSDSY